MRTVFIMLIASSLFACGGSVEKRQTSEPVAKPPALGAEEQALTDADPNASADMLTLARDCDGGNVTACTDLGKRYRAGDGVPKDADRGVALFERSCERDVYEACGRLAGALTPGDPERARTLATKACNAGNAIGLFLNRKSEQQAFDGVLRLFVIPHKGDFRAGFGEEGAVERVTQEPVTERCQDASN